MLELTLCSKRHRYGKAADDSAVGNGRVGDSLLFLGHLLRLFLAWALLPDREAEAAEVLEVVYLSIPDAVRGGNKGIGRTSEVSQPG